VQVFVQLQSRCKGVEVQVQRCRYGGAGGRAQRADRRRCRAGAEVQMCTAEVKVQRCRCVEEVQRRCRDGALT
jgi:hypothetical protein